MANWARFAVDQHHGGFIEQFHLDGRLDRQGPRRVRVAARQIYAFSQASLLGWDDHKQLVLNGVDWLMDRGWRADGDPGFIHLTHDDGSPADTRRDLYDHAFHILGLAQAYQATKDAQILALAKQTFDYVEEALTSEHSGWNETIEGSLPRRQNPHMHMFEALLALYAASKDTKYLNRADDILALLESRFIDPISGCLLEFFDPDWQAQTPHRVEPGHMVEWVWLLEQRSRISHSLSHPFCADRFLSIAEKLGKQETGLLIDTCSPSGDILSDSSRVWVQTEWLKAMWVTGQSDTKIENLIDHIFEQYLISDQPGMWNDAVTAQGEPLSKRVPASILYHFMSAATELERLTSAVENQETSCQIR
ncbi:MAG: hypothetical protein COA47_06290 [Robiginitomaculum sp.]|nr:MAG: hypothetical protein COA47_06290 [Robiginitomaculum sp.]